MNLQREFAKSIDHTLLNPRATTAQIRTLCEEAMQFGFAAVCIHPCRISICREVLQGSDVAVCTVIGFPLGAHSTETKVAEAVGAVGLGADELDMVINLGWAAENRWDAVEEEIAAVVKAAGNALVKVILETCYLSRDQIIAGCAATQAAGAGFVKTSTGFGSGGATLEQVRLMRQSVAAGVAVKASGGIRDLRTAKAMLDAGAARLGTSSGIVILDAWMHDSKD